MKRLLFLSFFLGIFMWSIFGNVQIASAVNCFIDNDNDGVSEFIEYSGVCVPADTGLPDPYSATDDPVSEVIANFLKWITYIFSFLAIIAFIAAGIIYLFSGGDQNRMDMAKKFVIGAITGVVVALISLMIIVAINTLFSGNTGATRF